MKDKKEGIECIQSSVDETGNKKNLNANFGIEGKGIRINAKKIYIKFPVEIAKKEIIEKTDEGIKDESAQIYRGGEEIELKNVRAEEGKLAINIPMLVQEILSTGNKE